MTWLGAKNKSYSKAASYAFGDITFHEIELLCCYWRKGNYYAKLGGMQALEKGSTFGFDTDFQIDINTKFHVIPLYSNGLFASTKKRTLGIKILFFFFSSAQHLKILLFMKLRRQSIFLLR